MRAFMWFMLIAAACLAFVIGCYPVTAPAASPAQVQNWASDWRPLGRICDDKGVCCYSYGGQAMQCVATVITLKHEDLIHNDYKSRQRPFPPQRESGSRVLETSLIGGPWETY